MTKKIDKLFERLKIILNKEWESPFYEERDEWVVALEVKVAFFLAFLCVIFVGLAFLSQLSWDNLLKFVSVISFIGGSLHLCVIDVYRKRYGYFPWNKKAP